MCFIICQQDTALYFDSFGIKCIPQDILNKIKDKSITHKIFRIQDNKSLVCGFYCVTFIDYILAVKALLDYTNLFSLNDYQKNDEIINKYFKDRYGRRSKSKV